MVIMIAVMGVPVSVFIACIGAYKVYFGNVP